MAPRFVPDLLGAPVESTMSVNRTVPSVRVPVSSSAAMMARPLAPQSSVTQGSSPTTHLSCPGGISNTLSGPMSSVWPSSMTARIVPEITYPTWRIGQEAAPNSGPTSVDQRQPGSNAQ